MQANWPSWPGAVRERIDPEQRRPDQQRGDQIQAVLGLVHVVVPQREPVDGRDVGEQDHRREQGHRDDRAAERPTTGATEAPARAGWRPPRGSANSASRTGAPAASSGATTTQMTMCSTMWIDKRVSASVPIPEYRSTTSTVEAGDEAHAATAGPAPTAPIAAGPDRSGRAGTPAPTTITSGRNAAPTGAVDAPVERERAHGSSRYWKISVVQSPPGRWISCGRAPSACSWKSTKNSGSSA